MTFKTTFESEITHRENCVVIQLIGDAGVGNADALAHCLLPVSAKPRPLVVFDLSELNFISSMGLGLLIEFQRGLARHGSITRLASPRPVVRDMLVKCRFDQVLPLFGSIEDAVAGSSPLSLA